MSNPWKQAVADRRKEAAKVPEGCLSIEQIAEQMDVTVDTASDHVQWMIKNGRVEVVQGKKLTITGALVATKYYRLVGKPKK